MSEGDASDLDSTNSTTARGGADGRTVAGGAAWSSVGRVGTQAAQFFAGLILARLLAPEEFGLYASVFIFSQFVLLFFELGMGTALVQFKDLHQRDLNTVFWVNAIGGVIFALLVAAAAPAIADFFGQPELRKLAPFAALAFTVNLSVCHLALLQRQMRFRGIALTELFTALIGFGVAISAAVAGAGVYALAVGTIVQQASEAIVLWRLITWRPSGFIDRQSLRRVWRYSRGLLGFNVVNYWGRNADNLLVGRIEGPAALGYYNRSYNFMLLPVFQISGVLGRVMLPALAELQNDPERASRVYRGAVKTNNLVAIPVLLGVAATAPALVPFVWGEQWTPMVPILMLLCIAGIPQCTLTSVGWIYQSHGRTGTMFWVGTLSSTFGIALMCGGVQWGVIGVSWAVLIRSWLTLIPELAVATRLIGIKARHVIKDAFPTMALAIGMAGIVWTIPEIADFPRDDARTLGAQILAGGSFYIGTTMLVQRQLLKQFHNLIRPSKSGK